MIANHHKRLDADFAEPRRRLRGVSLLPAAATLGNLLCGFLAVVCCLLAMGVEYGGRHPRWIHVFPTYIAEGAYLIVLAMVFDALDGRLARLTRRTSEFGAQLDSIADIVSFGVAPAALFITLLWRPAPGDPITVPDASRWQIRVGMTAALVYVACAAIRLARYNVENVKTESSQRAFSGLPSPGAAAAVVALVALHEDLWRFGMTVWGVDWANVSRWVIALTALAVGLLMVSRLDYVHIFNVYVRRKHPPTHLIWLIGVLGIGWYSFELLLVVLALAYVISGLVANILRHRRPPPPAMPRPEPAARAVDN